MADALPIAEARARCLTPVANAPGRPLVRVFAPEGHQSPPPRSLEAARLVSGHLCAATGRFWGRRYPYRYPRTEKAGNPAQSVF